MDDINVYGLQHVEVVTSRAAGEISKASKEIPGFRLCPQPNFWPFNVSMYSGKFPDKLGDYRQVVPLKTMIGIVGKENIDLGTDGMPSSLAYLAASSLFHPAPEGRLDDLDEFFSLVENGDATSRSDRTVRFDTNAFSALMNDMTRRKRYLSNPSGSLAAEIHSEVVLTD
jgi:hypothetical protein